MLKEILAKSADKNCDGKLEFSELVAVEERQLKLDVAWARASKRVLDQPRLDFLSSITSEQYASWLHEFQINAKPYFPNGLEIPSRQEIDEIVSEMHRASFDIKRAPAAALDQQIRAKADIIQNNIAEKFQIGKALASFALRKCFTR